MKLILKDRIRLLTAAFSFYYLLLFSSNMAISSSKNNDTWFMLTLLNLEI